MREKIQGLYNHFCLAKSTIYIALLCTIVIVLSTKGITDESVFPTPYDMSGYLMNGAYFYDLIRDLPIINPFKHAYQYFARYPALSLGHHPLFLGVAEVPFHAIFGISVFSARLTIVFFMLISAITWFFLIRLIYNGAVAFFSSLLFVTTPFIVKFSRIVMSEIPTLALIIVTTYLFYQYCEFDKKKYAFASAVSLSLSVYAKHVAIFILPVLLCYFLIKKGAKELISKEVIICCVITAVLITPLIPMTIKFSQSNVATVSKTPIFSKLALSNILYHIKNIWTYKIHFAQRNHLAIKQS